MMSWISFGGSMVTKTQTPPGFTILSAISGLETLSPFPLVSLLGVGKTAAKLLVAVLIVIVIYLTGLLVFKRKKGA